MNRSIDPPPRTFRPEAAASSLIVYRFLRETRAGATAVAAVCVTMMTLGAAALVVDHTWLVHQRDLLKSTTDAAAIAATIEFQDLPDSLSDLDAAARLQPIADRYVRFNLEANLPDASQKKILDSLDVAVTVDRDRGAIDVTAEADLGGTLLAKFLLADAFSGKVSADSGAEGSLGATEIVLAIDTTGSMKYSLDGSKRGGPTSRMSIVKDAAINLVDVLESFPNSVLAVGIVPWTWRARLDASTRARWDTEGWAVFPTERNYPHPTRGPPGQDRYLPVTQSLPSRSEIPQACRPWRGCPDLRLENGRPSFSTALPSAEPFVMGFFSSYTGLPESQYVSYQCQDYTRAESEDKGGVEPLCYDLDRASTFNERCNAEDVETGGPWRKQPQDSCERSAETTPLSSDLDEVRGAIRKLRASGHSTYSSVGVAWGIRMLDASWRDAWNHTVHPMDETTGVQKVLVLLTDGQDNTFRDAIRHRRDGCTAAKNAGIIVFTIAAMHPSEVGSSLANQLEACSSKSEDPDGSYVFVNNPTPEALKTAFADIVKQVVKLRRTH